MSQVAYSKLTETDLLRQVKGDLLNKWLDGALSEYEKAVFEMFVGIKARRVK